MTKLKKQSRRLGISDREIRQLAQLLELRWTRFDCKRSDRAGHKQLLSALRNRHVNTAIQGPCSHEDVVRRICQEAEIPIKSLASDLSQPATHRGKIIFDLAGRALDEIACNFTDMHWWFSDGRLVMDITIPPPEKDFRSVAGKMLVALRQSFPDQSRLTRDQYLKFASSLDGLGFTPLEVLPSKWARELSEWNQKNNRNATKSFQQAIYAQQPKLLHKALFKLFYDSEEKVKRNQKINESRS